MALIMKTQQSETDQDEAVAVIGEKQKRHLLRGPGRLLEQLNDPSPQVRRWAIRDLSAFPEAVKPLCHHLRTETVDVVREVVFTSLATIGGSEVVECLLPLLRSDDAALRNNSIVVLQGLPEDVEYHMSALMGDENVDVRGFAIDIMNGLNHPRVPEWLAHMLATEDDVNVCSKVVENLSEVGTPEHVPAIKKVLERFPDEPYLRFSVDIAIKRIMTGYGGT